MRRFGKERAGRSVGIHGTILLVLSVANVGLNTIFEAPPRFDGAGYAVLAESMRDGRGYRAIDHPDAPRHAHFPPGYPLVLAGLWSLTGPSEQSAHALAMACTVAATWAAWLWFRRLFRPGVALGLGAALAINWTWGRHGGSIQSEPLFLLLQMATLLAATWAGRGRGWSAIGPGVALGILLGATTLTRHVGIMLTPVVGMELWMRRKTATAWVALMTMAVVLAPWVGWLARIGRETQVGLLPRSGLLGLVASQALFYLRRLPDQISGPVVEVGTVFRPDLAVPVTAWAAFATALIVWGWLRCLRSPRRRLAGLVPLMTMPLLLVWPFTEAGRFLVPLVPFALIGAFTGLAALLGWLGLRRQRARAWAVGLVLAASLPYSAYAILSQRAAALQGTHADFDAACAWLARQTDHPGPLLTRQPGEAFWQTGRTALPPPGDDPEAIDRLIDRYGVAYLIVDEDRYAHAPTSPLGRYAAARPERLKRVWSRGGVAVVEVVSL